MKRGANGFRWIAILLCFASGLHAEVRLPAIFSTGMVLQRNVEIRVWGWASPGEKVKVGFNRRIYKTVTGPEGRWKVAMAPMDAGGPYEMVVKGDNTLRIGDILVGDVWFCSGQSNMVLPMDRVREKYPEVLTTANYPQIRNFTVPVSSDVSQERTDFSGAAWKAATRENVKDIGAVAFFFAQSLYDNYHIPVGIINSSVGGTPIQAWISRKTLQQFDPWAERLRQFADTAWLNRQLKPVERQKDEVNGMIPDGVFPVDQGLAGPLMWYDTAYVPKGWRPFWLPGYWDDQGVRNLHGVIWFRKDVYIPASMTGKPLMLYLGRIVDADQVYVNGTAVGSVSYQYPPRRYPIPPGMLRTGKNTLVVRVTNYAGSGGFVPDKPYRLKAGNDSIDLRGEWLYKVGQVFHPAPSSPAAFVMQNEPAGLFNTMVAPLTGFRIKGFLWYQGESNTGNARAYSELLPALIGDWRNKWQQGALPFLFVQLAGFMEDSYLPEESQWAELRFSQLKALSVENTAMAVALDAGEWNDIHPLSKKIVGVRLALAARKLAYGENLVSSGPLPVTAAREGSRLVCTFQSTGTGLMAAGGGELQGFAIAGADHHYVWAHAVIDSNRVIVWNDDIPQPLYVRYAWADNPARANLYNMEGLPASPFEASISP